MRPVEKPGLAVSGGLGGRTQKPVITRPEIKRLKKEYVDSALEQSTIASYSSLISQYENFCAMAMCVPWPASMEKIEDCSTWMMYSGIPSSVTNLWSAVKFFQSMNGFAELPPKSEVLKKLHVKAQKLAAASAKPLRDPLPIDAIVKFCNSKSSSDFKFVSDAALITVGCRALLRYNEIAKLRIKDVTMQGQLLKLDLGTRKNHKERAPPIFIEKSDNLTNSCPVLWMQRHLDILRMKGAKPDDFLFTSKMGKQISNADVGSIVKEVARVGNCGHLTLSSHSMRITGAVMMMMAGFDDLQIQLMGDWKSMIFLRYLRTIGIAARKATTRMGF
jgi:site-specific recombinase XerD